MQSVSWVRRCVGTVLALVVFGLAAPAKTDAGEFRVGDPFPTLSLPALADGSPASIRDFRGRKLVLHVWASW